MIGHTSEREDEARRLIAEMRSHVDPGTEASAALDSLESAVEAVIDGWADDRADGYVRLDKLIGLVKENQRLRAAG